jgi:excisionase family DNA binding protein
MGENQNNTSLEVAQIRNIINEDCTIAQDLIKDLLEMVGAISVDEYSKHLGISKRTIQDRLKKGNMPFIPVGGMRFPCINM